MRNISTVAVSVVAAGFLVACGEGVDLNEEGAIPTTPEAAQEAVSAPAEVSAQACTTLYRPRITTYWTSFPIEIEGQVGRCTTASDCTVTCVGETSQYAINSQFFYCTYCP
ncbi:MULTISPECIES: hypothetical protein [Myxococcus]|uniref:Lipoprotein n=1 Tax=Myxococcus virescens TaxID=83456 RepID=A0ABY0MTJ8_9BACT|nr:MULTISPECIES: hypothetical protein [Myxococcus]WNZ65479.1 hypothetical protein QEG98_18750 [Myxococcus sp. MxC21-1]SDE47818.1 hypothetical protein SAMN04488504_107190 [Myxococcus virescens]